MLALVGLSCLLPLPTLVTALVMGDDYSQLLLPVLLLVQLLLLLPLLLLLQLLGFGVKVPPPVRCSRPTPRINTSRCCPGS